MATLLSFDEIVGCTSHGSGLLDAKAEDQGKTLTCDVGTVHVIAKQQRKP